MSNNEERIAQLPLPLAQLLRRACNAKSVQERHHAAYYLWEAALKLLGATAVVCYVETGRTPDEKLSECLQSLARPSVGHWWGIVRALTVELADRDAAFTRIRGLLLGRQRDDLPRVAGLDAALLEVLEGRSGSRSAVRLSELFDRLVRYRNRNFGHGAVGMKREDHYQTMGRALLAGVPQLLEPLDVLAGRTLIYLADVRRLSTGAWLVERYQLSGETPRRLESLEQTHEQTAGLLPRQLYLAGDGLLPLHPLVGYDFDANEFRFLNSRRGKQRVESLCYTTGKVSDRVESAAQNALLGRLLGVAVDEAQRAVWEVRSQDSDGPPLEAPAPIRRLGEFELITELGRGGMGVVYRAWQPSLGRQVALKCLLKSGDDKAEKRFAREIAALGQVEHPHLVRIFTSGAEADRWFYAMELVEGTTLAAVCDQLQTSGSSAGALDLPTWQKAVSTACEAARASEKPLSDPEHKPNAQARDGGDASPRLRVGLVSERSYVRRIAELTLQTAEAVQALHDKGITHRDIKPGNIMVAPDGTSATLMDLGLAQLGDEVEGRLTRTREFVGTLRYASPEQVLAAARLDRRTDVYSLGATLWELLALRPLFGATDQTPTPEVMQRIQIEEPERLRRLNPAVPRDLAAIVEKCLQKDPRKRYATAQELAGELADFLANRPVKARPVTGLERLGKWAWRRPAQAASIGLLLVVLLGTFSGVLVFAWQAEQGRQQAEQHARRQAELRNEADKERDEAERQRKEAVRQKTLAQKAERKAIEERDFQKTLLANSSVIRAKREWDAGPLEKAWELLDGVPESLRRWEWHYLQHLFQGSYCTLYGHTDTVRSVAFSPDAKWLASASDDRTVRLWDAESGRLAHTMQGHTASVLGVAFSRDGHQVASASEDETVRLWDVATGRALRTLQGHTKRVWSVAFSSIGTQLATGGDDKTVRLWDLFTGQSVRTLEGHINTVRSLAFSSDGQRLASASDDRTLRIWNAASGQVLRVLQGHTAGVTGVAFSPDGKRLASASDDQTVRLWDAATGQMLNTLRGHTGWVLWVAFSPDGQQVASGSADQTIRVWDAVTGRTVRKLYGHTDQVWGGMFSPNGQRLVSAGTDRTVRLWDTVSGQSHLTLSGHTNGVLCVAFSPDGKYLASASEDKRVRLWDTATGLPLQTTLRHPARVRCVAFSPDGQHLACASAESVWLWHRATGQLLRTLQGHEHNVISVAFSPDGQRLASGSVDKTLRLWDTASGQPLRTLAGHIGIVTSVAFNPDGELLASASEDNTIRLWDPARGQLRHTLHGHTNHIWCVAFSPTGQMLASASMDSTVRIWDAGNGKLVHTLQGHTHTVNSVAFSSDGHRLASAGSDNTLRLWDPASGQLLVTLPEHSGAVASVAFSADGRRLASASEDKMVRLWDAGTGNARRILHGHTADVYGVAFSPVGQHLASASYDGTVRLWDVVSGHALRTLTEHKTHVVSVAFSPDGQDLASGEGTGSTSIRLWDLRSRRAVLTLQGHTGPVWSVAFSPNGQQLASTAGEPDQTVRLWDLTRGQCLHTFRGHTGTVNWVAFSPDGHRLASASNDKTVRLWDTTTGQLLQTLTGHTQWVLRVMFSSDGRVIWSRDSTSVRSWDTLTGKEVAQAGEPPLLPWREAIDPSSRLLAAARKSTIEVTDLGPPSPGEAAYRKAKARYNPFGEEERARKYEEGKSWFAAAFHRSQLAAYDPWNLANWDHLQSDCRELGNTGLAQAACDQLLRNDPALIPIYLRRGPLRLAAGDFSGAGMDLVRFLQSGAGDTRAWAELAEAANRQAEEAAQKGNWSQAVIAYRQATIWQPRDPWTLLRLAWALLAGGRDDEYREVCCWLNARFGKLESNRSVFALSLSLTQPAQILTPLPLVLEQAVEQDAANRAGAIVNTACLFPVCGLDTKDLVALGSRAIKCNPTSAPDRARYGAALYRAGRFKEAVTELEIAIKLTDNQEGTNWQKLFLAMAYLQLGQAERARGWRAEVKDPGKDVPWTQAIIWKQLGTEAAELLKGSQ